MTISSTSQKVFLVEQSNSGEITLNGYQKIPVPEKYCFNEVNMPILTLPIANGFNTLLRLIMSNWAHLLHFISQQDKWYTGEVQKLEKSHPTLIMKRVWYL